MDELRQRSLGFDQVFLEFRPAPEDRPNRDRGEYYGELDRSVRLLVEAHRARHQAHPNNEDRIASPILQEAWEVEKRARSHAPEVFQLILTVGTGGLAVALYKMLRAWVDLRNGRRIKVKLGALEVEVTQMSEKQFLHLLQTVKRMSESPEVLYVGMEKALKQEEFDVKRSFEEDLNELEHRLSKSSSEGDP
jgi:hypothetical protein